MSTDTDVIVIGAGHNGLTCAGYLARAGLRVTVLEARDVVGGAAVTEEFHPGFRNSVYSYSVSLLHPKVISDLQLARHGLEIMERPAGTLSLLENDHLLLTRDEAQAHAEIARFSPRDAERIEEFENEIAEVALALRALATEAPPNMGGGLRDILGLLKAGNRLRKLSPRHQGILVELMTRSLGDYLDMWFEGEALKGVLGLEGVIGNFAEPYQAGTAYVLLHHAFGEVNGRTGYFPPHLARDFRVYHPHPEHVVMVQVRQSVITPHTQYPPPTTYSTSTGDTVSDYPLTPCTPHPLHVVLVQVTQSVITP